MIVDVLPFRDNTDREYLTAEQRFARSTQQAIDTNEYQESINTNKEYTFRDKFKASFSEFVIGGNALAERQYGSIDKTLPTDERFVFSDTFGQLIKDNAVSADDEVALRAQGVGNEQEFLFARAKQERYRENQEIIKDMSPLALIATGIGMSVFDPSSWVLGGIVSKPFQMLYTGAKVGKYSLLALRGMEGASLGASINYATELSNQQAAGVQDDEKLLELASYGAMFGLALPVLPTAITQVSQGAYRSKGAQVALEYMKNSKAGNSVRKWFSVSAGEQTKWQSQNPLTQDYSWTLAPSAGVKRTADGTPIKQTETALERKTKFGFAPYKQLTEGLEVGAKDFGGGAEGWARASKHQGMTAFKDASELGQLAGKQLGELSQKDMIAIYKRKKGIDELPEEATRRVEVEKTKRELQAVETTYTNNQRNVQASVNDTTRKELSKAKQEANVAFKKMSEKDKKAYQKAQDASTKEQLRLETEVTKKKAIREKLGASVAKKLQEAKAVYTKKTKLIDNKITNTNKEVVDVNKLITSMGADKSKRGLLRAKQANERASKLQDKLRQLEAEKSKIKEPDYEAIKKELLSKAPEDLKELPQRSFVLSKELNDALKPTKGEVTISSTQALAIQKRVQARFDRVMRTMETKAKKLRKELEELQAKRLDEPDDLLNTVRDVLQSELRQQGKWKRTKGSEHVGEFFEKYSKWGTERNVGGIAGRDGYGFNPRYMNRDLAISQPDNYKRMLTESITGDSYNQALLARGEITLEDIAENVERLYQRALSDDVKFKYLEKGIPARAGTSSKARTLQINSGLHPELYVTDLVEVAGRYSREMGGRYAFIDSFGIDPYGFNKLGQKNRPTEVIDSLLKEVATKGDELGLGAKAIKKDVENLRAMFEDVLDVRRLQTNPDMLANIATRTLKALASTAFSAGFVKYNMVEWLAGTTHNGFGRTMKTYLPAWQDTLGLIRNGKAGSPEFEAMRHTVLYSHQLMGHLFNRLEANELTGRLSVIENGIHQVNANIRKYSAFNLTTDINEMAAGGAAMSKMFSLNPDKLSRVDADWLSRYGFDGDDLKAVMNNPSITRAPDGTISNYGVGTWKDTDLERKFTLFMERAARDVIPVPNAAKLHRFQSDVNDPIKSLFFQYSQVPTVLHENILLTALERPTADAAMGLGMSTMGMYMILKMDDELRVRLGLRDEATDDTQMLTRAFLNTGFMGITGMASTSILNALGQEGFGTTFRPGSGLEQIAGAGGSILNKGVRALGQIGGGDIDDGADTVMSMSPLNSIPLLGLFLNAANKKAVDMTLRGGDDE